MFHEKRRKGLGVKITSDVNVWQAGSGGNWDELDRAIVVKVAVNGST